MKRLRTWLVVSALAIGCLPRATSYPIVDVGPRDVESPQLGELVDHMVDDVFDGGQVELDMYRQGTHVVQVARNRYAVPVTIHWTLSALDNLEPLTATEGVTVLPAAPVPLGTSAPIVLAELQQADPYRPYRRELAFHARFGDPRTEPQPYVYGLPYPHGLRFSVLQGFHGAFSHRGSNEYAIDFDCPVATPVVAARPGIVVAVNAAAQGAGTTAEYLDYKRTNFVIIRHDDGTLGEYMLLSPSGIEVKPGQHVARGQELALSGNSGFSSTPHLHFDVMTAADDGVAARSFPFVLAVAPGRVEQPVEGKSYAAWE